MESSPSEIRLAIMRRRTSRGESLRIRWISARFRSANLIAQLNATLAGFGIAVLPHFMASDYPQIVAVLPEEVSISRTFWLLMHADSKDLARIRAVADYIGEIVERERALFAGR